MMNRRRVERGITLDDLLVFHTVARSLGSNLERDAILRSIFAHIERFIETELWTLLMLDEAQGELYCAITSRPETDWGSLRIKADEGVAGLVLKNGQSLIIPEDDARVQANEEFPFISRANPKFRLRSLIALPLIGRAGTLGVLELVNPKTNKLNDATIAMLHILADYAAIAIENAEDVERIQRLTITDDVTGLYNVRHLYVSVQRAFDEARGRAFSFAFLDLDHFKSVNDTYGHLAGSELLAQVGRRLRALSRAEDKLFRYGGDEFALLLPGTEHEAAMAHLSELLERLRGEEFEIKSGVRVRVNASIGVASAPKDAKDIETLIATADARMYFVKENGRAGIRGGA